MRWVALALAWSGCSPSLGAVGSPGPSPAQSVATATAPLSPTGARTADAGNPQSASNAAASTRDAGANETVHKAEAWIASKGRFKPTGDEFPQIIQRTDYETIQAIEALYAELERIDGTSHSYEIGDEQPLFAAAQSDGILLRGRKDVTTIGIATGGATLAGKRLNQTTSELFATLQRVLVSLASDFPAAGVRATRYGARSYRSITRIEFAFPPLVVQLDGMSNGKGNRERLYVLDVDRVTDSFLWRR